MKIKNKLYISAGVAIILVAIVLSSVVVTSARIDEEGKKHKLLMNVYIAVSEIDIVTYDYLLHREERMEQQWYSRYSSLGEILGKAPEEEGLISIRAEYTAIGDLFSQVIVNNEIIQTLNQEGAPQEEIDIATVLEKRLVTQLLIASHSILTSSYNLAEEAHTKELAAQRLGGTLTLILMIALAITVTSSSFFIARSISKPLSRLANYSRKVGEGEYTADIEIKGKDEVASVASDVKSMVGQLLATGKQLDNELTERKRAEERIKHLNITLRAVRNVNQLITHEKDRQRLIQQSCDILVKGQSNPLAWIALIDENKEIISTASSGVPAEHFSTLIDKMKQGDLPHCMRALLQQREPFVVTENVRHDHEGCPLVNVHEGGAGFACRLEYERKLYGTMSVDVPPDIASDKEEQGLFFELCSDISFALANIERQEKRRRTEKKLYESEQKYRSLVENVKVGVFRSTPGENGRFLEVNPAMEKITGYTRDELLKINVSDLYIYPEERKTVSEKAVQATGKVAEELNFKKKDGTQIIVFDIKTPVRGSNGEVLYFDGILEDITERKNMEEQLIITDRLASVGELAAGVAHELNNPLTSVIGFSQLLLEKDIPDDVKEDVKIISSEAQRTARIVKNLLTFGRKHAPVKEPVSINTLIEKVLELRAYEQRVNNIEVITRFAADLPEIMGDFFQLQQVFLNIVINAEYFMIESHGKGTLEITTERAKGVIRASFNDNGPGIPKENLGRLFDPFFTTKEVGKGTGLGLSICYGIVTEHGGRIYAESELGKGTTFVLELPVTKT